MDTADLTMWNQGWHEGRLKVAPKRASSIPVFRRPSLTQNVRSTWLWHCGARMVYDGAKNNEMEDKRLTPKPQGRLKLLEGCTFDIPAAEREASTVEWRRESWTVDL
jgi:hypothetical protein